MNRGKEAIKADQNTQIKSAEQVQEKDIQKLLADLSDRDYFNRNQMLEEFQKEVPKLSEAGFKYQLQKLLKKGELEHVGRNKYCVAGKKKMCYEYRYSQTARNLALKIVENFTYVEFRIFEPLQVYELINDGYSSDIVFVYMDADYFSRAEETLEKIYAERVLVKPDEEKLNGKIMYEKPEGWIVLNPLVSEAPRGRERLWHTDLEKMMLTDLISDKVLRSLWSDSQLVKVFETVFDKYYIDESKMLRYARRRRGAEKLINFIKENTDVKLRTA